MSNVAQEYSCNTLAEMTRLRSVHTAQKYLRHLEEAFLFFSVRRFCFKVRDQARANRKVYCTDNGLVTAASFRLSPGRGRLYENLAAIALRKQELDGRLELNFWKGPQHEEVDFVVKQGLHVTQLLQVCANIEDPKTKAREVSCFRRNWTNVPGCCRIRIGYYEKRPLQTSAGLLDVQVISSTP